MEYTIQKLANLAGITTRTLRYYDEIGLLHPCRQNSSGYRIYGGKEVDRLQQILFYRSLDLPLEEIQTILRREESDMIATMEGHKEKLLEKRLDLDRLIATVEMTIAHHKGERNMSDKEKFEGFKKQKLAENEKKYGKEIREKYGEATVEASNKKFLNLSEEDVASMSRLEEEMIALLKTLAVTKDMDSQEAKEVCLKHKEWLCYSWPSYQPQAHVGLAQMYVADERFAQYYRDKAGMDVAELLRDAIVTHAK
jgi:DNA-binding transcriptional MerR regulator